MLRVLILIEDDFVSKLFCGANMAPEVGFEPTTNSLTASCATTALLGSIFERAKYTEGAGGFQLDFLQYDNFPCNNLVFAVVDKA